MTVEDVLTRLQELDPSLRLTYVAWDADTKQFTKWGLSGITSDGTMVLGDLIDTRIWPDVFE